MRSMVHLSILGLIVSLCGCSVTTIAPAYQLQSLAPEMPLNALTKSGHNVVKKQIIHEYHCAHKKIVRIQQPSNKKNAAITVLFNNTSYKLSPAVSSKGKKYSNIRWTWLEGLDGKAMLSNNRNKVLAENCVKN